MGDEIVNQVYNYSKGDMVKELVRSFHQFIPVMKLALLNKDTHSKFASLAFVYVIHTGNALLEVLLAHSKTCRD